MEINSPELRAVHLGWSNQLKSSVTTVKRTLCSTLRPPLKRDVKILICCILEFARKILILPQDALTKVDLTSYIKVMANSGQMENIRHMPADSEMLLLAQKSEFLLISTMVVLNVMLTTSTMVMLSKTPRISRKKFSMPQLIKIIFLLAH